MPSMKSRRSSHAGRLTRIAFVAPWIVLLVACGGGGDGGAAPSPGADTSGGTGSGGSGSGGTGTGGGGTGGGGSGGSGSETTPVTGGGAGADPRGASACWNPVVWAAGTTVIQLLSQPGSQNVTTVTTNFTDGGTQNGVAIVTSTTKNLLNGVAQPGTVVDGLVVTDRHASVASRVSANVSGSTSITYSPAMLLANFALDPGQTDASSGTATGIVRLGGYTSPSVTSTYRSSLTFLGIEAVTVPAGVFQACKFYSETSAQTDGAAQSVKQHTWVAQGSGIAVQWANAADSSVPPMQLNSATVNGVAVVP